MKFYIIAFLSALIMAPWFLQAHNDMLSDAESQILIEGNTSMNTTKVDKTRLSQETIESKLNEAASLVQFGGTYFHFKDPNNLYKVLGVCLSADSLDQMVIYQALYGVHGVWVRPLSQWLEKVEFEGKLVDRFTLIGQMDDEGTCDQDCDGEHCT